MITPPVKPCSKCGESKPLAAYSKHSRCSDGLRPRCKQCLNAEAAVYRSRNADGIRAGSRDRYWLNPEAAREKKRLWKSAHPGSTENSKAYGRKRYAAMPEYWADRKKNEVADLHDNYVKEKLAQMAGCSMSIFPPEIVKAKRLQLMCKRLLKESAK